MKRYLFSLKFSILILLSVILLSGYSYPYKKGTYISLAPSITEIIYAIGAQDNLIAVSRWCDYPDEARKKPKIADAFSINREAIIRQRPGMIFALVSQKPLVDDLKNLGIKIHYFAFENFEDVLKGISEIGRLSNHKDTANKLVSLLNRSKYSFKSYNKKKIFYVVQAEPLISIGNKSYINDLINKSGNISITGSIKAEYPTINLEYVLSKKPDIVVVNDENSAKYLKQFLNSKFIILNNNQRMIINRPGPRILDAIGFFTQFK